MSYPTEDYSFQTKARTYADVGDDDQRSSSQIIRRRPGTLKRVMDDVAEETYQTIESEISEVANSMLSSQKRRSTYTDPSIAPSIRQDNRRTAPSQKLQNAVKNSKKAKKHPVFYVGIAASLALSGVLIWNTVVSPTLDHWHDGDSPERSAQYVINGQLCDVESMYRSGKVVVVIVPADIKQKPEVLEMKVFVYNNKNTPVVTVEKNGNELQTYIDGQPGPRIVNNSIEN